MNHPEKSPWQRAVRSIRTVLGGFKRGLVLLDLAGKKERPYDGRLVPQVLFDSFGSGPGRNKNRRRIALKNAFSGSRIRELSVPERVQLKAGQQKAWRAK
eukprot:299634-Pleurochrysis_carterae.AAC.1